METMDDEDETNRVGMVPKRFMPKNSRQRESNVLNVQRAHSVLVFLSQKMTTSNISFLPPQKGCKKNFTALRAA